MESEGRLEIPAVPIFEAEPESRIETTDSATEEPAPATQPAPTSPAPVTGSPEVSATAPLLIAKLPSQVLAPPVVRKAGSRLVTPVVKAAVAKRESPAASASPPADTEYIVRPGDNIIRLAKRFGVSTWFIVQLNHIENPSLIRIGDKLRIPAAEMNLVYIRPVFEEAGGVVTWDHETKVVRAVCPQNDVELKIGSPQAVVNSLRVTMDRPAMVQSGRTLVPESFVTQTLDMSVPSE